MARILSAAFLAVFGIAAIRTASPAAPEVYFTPNQPADQVILREVAAAKSSVYIASFHCSWKPLAALLRKLRKERGIDVRTVLDEEPPPDLKEALNARANTQGDLFHSKFLVVDDRTVIIGSFNLTDEHFNLHHNNMLVFRDQALAGYFRDAFRAVWENRDVEKCYESPAVSVYFSPECDGQEIIRRYISSARASLHLAEYDFTSEPLAQEIVRRKAAGVETGVIFENSTVYPYSTLPFLTDFKVPAKRSSRAGLLHDKFLVLDGTTVITGSYNLSRAAAANREVVVIVRDPAVAAQFNREWRRLWRFYALP